MANSEAFISMLLSSDNKYHGEIYQNAETSDTLKLEKDPTATCSNGKNPLNGTGREMVAEGLKLDASKEKKKTLLEKIVRKLTVLSAKSLQNQQDVVKADRGIHVDTEEPDQDDDETFAKTDHGSTNNVKGYEDDDRLESTLSKAVPENYDVFLHVDTSGSSLPSGFNNGPASSTGITGKDFQYNAEKGIYSCDYCGKTFPTSSKTRRHVHRHTRDGPYKCSLCDRIFISKQALEMHTRQHSEDNSHKSTECNMSFTGQSLPTTHLKLHSAEKPFTCSICNKSFKEKSALRKHYRVHEGLKPYICSVCDRAFAQTNHLRSHMRMHTGERPFICSVCSKAFTDSSDLKRHIRVHTGERPFTCSVCHKSFRQSGYLNYHMRMHTGDKPHLCSICGKGFQSNSNLLRHIRIHTGEKPFQCEACDKRFLKSYSLKRHMGTCTGLKPDLSKRHQCVVCLDTFAKNYSLKRHIEKIHPGILGPNFVVGSSPADSYFTLSSGDTEFYGPVIDAELDEAILGSKFKEEVMDSGYQDAIIAESSDNIKEEP